MDSTAAVIAHEELAAADPGAFPGHIVDIRNAAPML